MTMRKRPDNFDRALASMKAREALVRIGCLNAWPIGRRISLLPVACSVQDEVREELKRNAPEVPLSRQLAAVNEIAAAMGELGW